MKVCVLGGAGYVGLVTGLGFAEIGHQVISVDVNTDAVWSLQAGRSHIYEPGLEEALRRNLTAGRIRFSTDQREALSASEVVFITVGTPSLENGKPDLSQIESVAKLMARQMDGHKTIVLKSTVPIGALQAFERIIRAHAPSQANFSVAVNPEFLREGSGLEDFFYPDRIVIGASSKSVYSLIRELYAPIINREYSWTHPRANVNLCEPVPVIETDPVSAQIIKYAANAFLATRVSFINEIAAICERVGVDIKGVSKGLGYDPRIGSAYLQAGLGFGGPCLEKDLRALIHHAKRHRFQPKLLDSVLDRNEEQVRLVLAKAREILQGRVRNQTIAVFGLSYKPGTNDVRHSPSMRVVRTLENQGALLRCHDPLAIPDAQALNPSPMYCDDPYEAVDGAAALLILTDWPSYRSLDYAAIKERMASPCIVDARNILDPAELRSLGFSYVSMGRP